MYQQLKSEIKNIIEIVNQCPDSLKDKCFELLLENYLASFNIGSNTSPAASVVNTMKKAETDSEMISAVSSKSDAMSDDICEKDFHVKTQKFLKDYGISMSLLNQLYYKENGELKPFYETLKSTSMQECQMRLAVLSAFENSFASSNSEMSFNCETVRSRCQTMKCYNATNFTAYFKSNKSLWEEWPEKYSKDFVVILSSEGKKKLAEVLLDMAEAV